VKRWGVPSIVILVVEVGWAASLILIGSSDRLFLPVCRSCLYSLLGCRTVLHTLVGVLGHLTIPVTALGCSVARLPHCGDDAGGL